MGGVGKLESDSLYERLTSCLAYRVPHTMATTICDKDKFHKLDPNLRFALIPFGFLVVEGEGVGGLEPV